MTNIVKIQLQHAASHSFLKPRDLESLHNLTLYARCTHPCEYNTIQYNTIQCNTIHLYYIFREMCLQWDTNNLQTHLHTGLHTHTCILTLDNYNNNSTVLEHEMHNIIAA